MLMLKSKCLTGWLVEGGDSGVVGRMFYHSIILDGFILINTQFRINMKLKTSETSMIKFNNQLYVYVVSWSTFASYLIVIQCYYALFATTWEYLKKNCKYYSRRVFIKRTFIRCRNEGNWNFVIINGMVEWNDSLDYLYRTNVTINYILIAISNCPHLIPSQPISFFPLHDHQHHQFISFVAISGAFIRSFEAMAFNVHLICDFLFNVTCISEEE